MTNKEQTKRVGKRGKRCQALKVLGTFCSWRRSPAFRVLAAIVLFLFLNLPVTPSVSFAEEPLLEPLPSTQLAVSPAAAPPTQPQSPLPPSTSIPAGPLSLPEAAPAPTPATSQPPAQHESNSFFDLAKRALGFIEEKFAEGAAFVAKVVEGFDLASLTEAAVKKFLEELASRAYETAMAVGPGMAAGNGLRVLFFSPKEPLAVSAPEKFIRDYKSAPWQWLVKYHQQIDSPNSSAPDRLALSTPEEVQFLASREQVANGKLTKFNASGDFASSVSEFFRTIRDRAAQALPSEQREALKNFFDKYKDYAVFDKSELRPLYAQETVTLTPAVTYQTMGSVSGPANQSYAEAVAWFPMGDPRFYNASNPNQPLPWEAEVVRLNVDELGIKRLRLEIGSRIENTVDHWMRYVTGQITYQQWRTVRYESVNDNNDPNNLNWSGFKFSELDYYIRHIVLPMQARLAAKGEKLYINLNFVAFDVAGLDHSTNPNEYAEMILATFTHMRDTFGFVPDAVDIILEPENTPAWTGTKIGQAIVATAQLLSSKGFRVPDFVLPSVTNAANAVPYFDQVLAVAGIGQYIPRMELSFHLYGGGTTSVMQQIAARAKELGIRTSMLEWWASNNLARTFTWLLGTANVSAVQGDALAGDSVDICSTVFYCVNTTTGTVTPTAKKDGYAAYFNSIKGGAIRIGAASTNSNLVPLAFINPDGTYVVVVESQTTGGSFTVGNLLQGTYKAFYTLDNQPTVYLADVQIGPSGVYSGNLPGLGQFFLVQKSSSSTTPPVITVPPQSATVVAPNTATFTVTASGTGTLTYQWRKNGVDLVDGGNISGATTAALTITNAGVPDAGSYDVTVTNNLNGTTATTVSATATLTVNFVISAASASLGSTSATINWLTPFAGDSQVYYGTTTAYGSSAFDPVSVTNHSVALSGLLPNTTYHDFVVTSDSTGTRRASSADLIFTTLPAQTIPTAPAGLTATAVSATQINLSWTDASNNEDGFTIERSPMGGMWQVIATVGPGVTTHSETGLSVGTMYHYRVRAYNQAGSSAYSNEVMATTPQPVPSTIPEYILTMHDLIPTFGADQPTVRSVRSGNWSDAGIWSNGRLPQAGDVVLIDTNTVTYDVFSDSAIKTVAINQGGKLVFRTDGNTRLTVQNFLVLPGGELEIGTATNPVAANMKAEVVFADKPLDNIINGILSNDPQGFGNGLIALGKVTMHGAAMNETFVRVAVEPKAGDTTLTLEQPVSGWRVGDRLVLPDTRQLLNDIESGPRFVWQGEILTIAAISADGKTLTLAAPLKYDHLGARDMAGKLDFLPHVNNLDRNIVIRSENPAGTRGHIMFTDRPDVDIRYAGFYALGRTTNEPPLDNTLCNIPGDSTPPTHDKCAKANREIFYIGTNQIARYPIHFHHATGPMMTPANGYQYTFEGNSVFDLNLAQAPAVFTPDGWRGGEELQNRKWAVVVHDSHYGLLRGNILFNYAGAGFMVETGNESFNVFEKNSMVKIFGAAAAGAPGDRNTGIPSGIWAWSHNNRFRDNVVANAGLAYYLYAKLVGTVMVPRAPGMMPDLPVNMNATPVLEFAGNEAYSDHAVLDMWWQGSGGEHSIPIGPSIIKDLHAWHISSRVWYPYEVNNIVVDGLIARGDPRTSELNGNVAVNGNHYFNENSIVQNSDIQGFYVGYNPAPYAPGVSLIKDSYFNNIINFRFDIMNVTKFVPARKTVLDNVRFGVFPPDKARWLYGGPANIAMAYATESLYGNTNRIQKNEVFVYNYNGVAGDNFKVYYNEQRPDYVMPPYRWEKEPPFYTFNWGGPPLDQTGGVPITNRQAYDNWAWRYDRASDKGVEYAPIVNGQLPAGDGWQRLAIAGEVAPADAATRPEINGLISPLSSTDAPVITGQPSPATQTVNAGANVSFTVGASGSGTLTYQWRKNGVNLTNGGNISGAVSATLTLSNVQLADAGSYDVVVSNGILPNATSNRATLMVNPPSPPTIPAAPTGLNATAVSATQINLSWTDASNNEDGFKVERKMGPGGSWVQITALSANVRSYSDASVLLGAVPFYRIRAYNTSGDSPYSNEISVNRAPVFSPVGVQSVAENAALTLTLSASDPDGDVLSYSASGLPTGAVFDPAARIFSWIPGYMQSGSYTVTFSVTDGRTTVPLAVGITVTNVNRPPAVSVISHNPPDADPNATGIQFYEGTAVTYSASASDADGDGLNWTWYYTVNGGSRILFRQGTGAIQDAVYVYSQGSAGSTYEWILNVTDGTSPVESGLAVNIIPVLPPPDTTPPVVSNVRITNVTSTGASIAWDTDEDTDTFVEFGLAIDNGYPQFVSTQFWGRGPHVINLVNLSPGTDYKVRISSADGAGNFTQDGPYFFTTMDAPAITITQPVSNSTVMGVIVNVIYTKSGDLTGVDHIHFKLDSGSEVRDIDFDGAYTFLNVPEGAHILTGYLARADHSKVLGTNVLVRFTTVISDTTPPVISGTVVIGLTGVEATVSWQTDENSDSQIEYGATPNYGSSTNLNTSPVTNHIQTISGLTAGTLYYYKVKSKDAAGNFAFEVGTFTTVGTIITSPSAGSTVGGTVTVTYTKLGDLALAGVTYARLQLDNQPPVPDPDFDGTYVFSNLPSGAHTVRVVLMRFDNSEVQGTEASVTFTVDATPPGISAVNASNVTETGATITWTTDEPATSRVEYRKVGTAQFTATPVITSLDINHTVTLTGLEPDASYQFQVLSEDERGNKSISALLTFTTVSLPDTTPPVISNVAVTNVTPTGATITWTTDEPADTVLIICVQGLMGPIACPGLSDPLLVTSHRVSLDGLLNPNTTYTISISSTDGAGNLATWQDFTITTPTITTPALPVPVVAITMNAGDASVQVTADRVDPIADHAHIQLEDATGNKIGSEIRLALGATHTFTNLANGNYVVWAYLARTDHSLITETRRPFTIFVSRPPVANAQPVNTHEDTAKTVVLTGTDPDNQSLTFVVVSGPTNGALSGLDPNTGQVTYTPNTDFNGTDSFTFKVNDGGMDSPLAAVTITVTPVNDGPIAIAQTVVTDEDTPKAITLAASDVDGDALTFTIVSSPANGTLLGTGANLTYVPNLNFNGADSFTFRANDGTMDSQPPTIQITVNSINDLPAAYDRAVTTPEDAAVSITLVGSDPDGAAGLIFNVINPPGNGTLSGTGANLVYTPDADFFGTDTFTYLVSDGLEDSNMAAVTITVTAVNDAPAVTDISFTGDEDTPVSGNLTATDADGDTPAFALATGPAHGSAVVNSDGSFIYTPNFNFNGTDSFTYTVQDDGGLLSNAGRVAFTVRSVNDAPSIANQSVVTDEDVPANFTLVATDVDGDQLTFTAATNPSNGNLICTSQGVCTYTPNPNYNGPDSFTVSVSDGMLSRSAAVSVTVNPMTDVPVARAQSVTGMEDQAIVITLGGVQTVDGTVVNYAVVTQPAHGSVVIAGNQAVYMPTLDFNGADSFTYTASIPQVLVGPATVSITITPVNDPPVTASVQVSTLEDTAVSGMITASDVDGDNLTYTVQAGAGSGQLTLIPDGSFTYTPYSNRNGMDSFIVKVSDGQGGEAFATILIDVTAVNDAPVADVQAVSTTPGSPVAITLTAGDPDGDGLTFTVASAPANGTLSGTAPNLTYTPNPGFTGTDVFTFNVSDGQLAATGSVTVTVANVPAPVNPVGGGGVNQTPPLDRGPGVGSGSASSSPDWREPFVNSGFPFGRLLSGVGGSSSGTIEESQVETRQRDDRPVETNVIERSLQTPPIDLTKILITDGKGLLATGYRKMVNKMVKEKVEAYPPKEKKKDKKMRKRTPKVIMEHVLNPTEPQAADQAVAAVKETTTNTDTPANPAPSGSGSSSASSPSGRGPSKPKA